ncbi:Fic family protein [Microbacterium sp. NPDC058062]|uniref:Fic family protein n=1 Tax=Microbacterium sp. NPDC058062 TaxID=3346320 RepID=UPI0036D8E6D1
MLRHIDVSIPPLIADLAFEAPPGLVAETERAVIEIATTDAEARAQSHALGRFLLRTESAASSKIERVSASVGDYARALAGSRANPSAVSMVAASAALHRMVQRAGEGGSILLEDLLAAHRVLMSDDPAESPYAGRLRDMQNCIGGSNHSARGALFVPPPPELVPRLLDDLLAWAARDDVPAVIHAAIAHAQFESIHPFTDGNGRIGRALISAILRRRGVARNVVIPLASGILAVRDDYFAALTSYRAGDPVPVIVIVCRSAVAAAVASRASMDELRALPDEWRRQLTGRKSAAADRIIDALFDNPVMAAEELVAASGSTTAAAYTAIDRLVDAGVLTEITGRKRDRVWAATDALGELEELDRRIQTAMTA